MTVQAPGGKQFTVEVPPGASPGMKIQVQAPSSEQGGQSGGRGGSNGGEWTVRIVDSADSAGTAVL
jgi:hypothetical protein